jgi:hypothetical protein
MSRLPDEREVREELGTSEYRRQLLMQEIGDLQARVRSLKIKGEADWLGAGREALRDRSNSLKLSGPELCSDLEKRERAVTRFKIGSAVADAERHELEDRLLNLEEQNRQLCARRQELLSGKACAPAPGGTAAKPVPAAASIPGRSTTFTSRPASRPAARRDGNIVVAGGIVIVGDDEVVI